MCHTGLQGRIWKWGATSTKQWCPLARERHSWRGRHRHSLRMLLAHRIGLAVLLLKVQVVLLLCARPNSESRWRNVTIGGSTRRAGVPQSASGRHSDRMCQDASPGARSFLIEREVGELWIISKVFIHITGTKLHLNASCVLLSTKTLTSDAFICSSLKTYKLILPFRYQKSSTVHVRQRDVRRSAGMALLQKDGLLFFCSFLSNEQFH